MGSHEGFRQNLARIRRHSPGVAAQLEETQLGPQSELLASREGAPTARFDGIQLASAYDPKREGERLAEEMNRAPADLMVAVGFGLGYHLEAYRRLNPCPILVFEPSLERLRLAFEARPAMTLLESDVKLEFDTEKLPRLFSRFYTSGLRVQVFVHPTALQLDGEAVQRAVSTIARSKETRDILVRTKVKMSETWAQATVANLGNLVRHPGLSALNGKFRGVPAVVVAAGPSLDKQIPLLKENADRLLIIAIGQSLRSLREAGITPDLVHIVESQNVSHQITCAGESSDVNLVVVPSAHPEIFEIPVRSRYVAYVAANPLGCFIGSFLGERKWMNSGGTVAQTAVYLAASLGANPVVLLGQDLAFSEGRIYAKQSAYEDVGFETNDEGKFIYTNLERKHALFGKEAIKARYTDLIWVEGWDGKPVPTNLHYSSFREGYRDLGVVCRMNGVDVINCTEGGAKIPGLDHRRFAEVLETCPVTPVDGRAIIQDAYDAHQVGDVSEFQEEIRHARRHLRDLEREADAGLSLAEAAPRKLRMATAPQAKIDILRRIARPEKRIRKQAAAVSWIDALVQSGIFEVIASTMRVDAQQPTPERAVDEARALFEATKNGVERARELLDQLDAGIEALLDGPENAG